MIQPSRGFWQITSAIFEKLSSKKVSLVEYFLVNLHLAKLQFPYKIFPLRIRLRNFWDMSEQHFCKTFVGSFHKKEWMYWYPNLEKKRYHAWIKYSPVTVITHVQALLHSLILWTDIVLLLSIVLFWMLCLLLVRHHQTDQWVEWQVIQGKSQLIVPA